MATPTTPGNFEHIPAFNLLINRILPGKTMPTADYILNLFAFLREAERLNARNLIFSAPHEALKQKMKLHAWINTFVIPQLTHIGIERTAIVAECCPISNKEGFVVSGSKPEIGLFSSMPEAKAWVIGLIKSNERRTPLSHSIKSCHQKKE